MGGVSIAWQVDKLIKVNKYKAVSGNELLYYVKIGILINYLIYFKAFEIFIC